MSPSSVDQWFVCTAHKTNGERCRAPAMRGARVCQAHGGMAGHVREAARARIERLVEPAIGTLREVMLRGDSHTVRLKAAESILDRAGIVAEQKVEVDNQVTVRVSYEDVELAQTIVDVASRQADGREWKRPRTLAGPRIEGHEPEG